MSRMHGRSSGYRRLAGCLVAALGLTGPLRSAGAAPEKPELTRERLVESRALHRRLDLTTLEVYSPALKTWRPYVPPKDKVFIINLWSKSCVPCLQEMPELARLSRLWARRTDVEFLLAAAPPDEMSRAAVEEFFRRRIYDAAPGEACPGHPNQPPSTATRHCDLELPAIDPVRCRDERLVKALGTELKPITLLVDPRGIVRQVFVGAIVSRGGELFEAVDRLVEALRPPR